MSWDVIVSLGAPLLGLIAVSGFTVLDRVAATRTLFRRSRHETSAIDSASALSELPAGLRRTPAGDATLDPTWLDCPPVLGKLFGVGAWWLLAFALMLASNVALIIDNDRHLIASMTAKTLCIALVPFTLVYVKHLLAGWLECVGHFVARETPEVLGELSVRFRNLFVARSSMSIAVMAGSLILLFEYYDNAFVHLSAWRWLVVVFSSFVMTVFAALGLVVIIRGAVLVSRVGRLPIYVSGSPYGVLATGTMLAKAFGAATGVYVVALLTMVLRTRHPDWLILSWACAVAGLYVLMFLLPQWSIHRRMVTFKRHALFAVETQLQRHLRLFDGAPDKATSDIVEALRKRRDEVVALPEWPFNWKNFSSVLGLAASSTLPLVVKAVFSSLTVPITLKALWQAMSIWLGPLQASFR
jgi:hypothetical protein